MERNRDFQTLLVVSVLVMTLSRLTLAQYGGGTGDPNDPYQIATAEQLTSIGSDPNDLAKYFVLVADIDLDPNLSGNRVFDRAVIAPDANDTAFGFQGPAFTGVFDGQDHAIARLVIDSNSTHAGLFGWIDSGGRVRNLRLVGGSVRGQAFFSGRESGPSGGTGSLAGENRGLVVACRGAVLVKGTYQVGGLVGYNPGGTITACSSTGPVSGGRSSVGGLVGYDSIGTINACHSSGSVNGDYGVGGLVGYNFRSMISACHSTGSVSGNISVGGLVGNNYDGTITSCSSTGTVTGAYGVGGLVGYGYGTVSACFWDAETSGWTTSEGGTGLTTSEMMAVSTFLDAGWDFVGERANGLHEYWQMPIGGGYPLLSVFEGFVPRALKGAGTAEDPYLLETAEDLGTVWYRPAASYRLAADIDLVGMEWGMAVIPALHGRLDGQGHRIGGLNISGGGHLGLIGRLAQGAVVLDLGLEDANVVGTGDRVGGLVGENSGTISACYSAGSVCGDDYVGGLVGDNYGAISACYGTDSVSGEGSVGGLVGHNYGGTISVCYSIGSVQSQQRGVGGLVGRNDLAGTVSACFWDTETSGRTTSDGGTGLPTSLMQAIGTFLEAGWDFIDEMANGTEDIWWILEGQDYPRLWWEVTETP